MKSITEESFLFLISLSYVIVVLKSYSGDWKFTLYGLEVCVPECHFPGTGFFPVKSGKFPVPSIQEHPLPGPVSTFVVPSWSRQFGNGLQSRPVLFLLVPSSGTQTSIMGGAFRRRNEKESPLGNRLHNTKSTRNVFNIILRRLLQWQLASCRCVTLPLQWHLAWCRWVLWRWRACRHTFD